MDPEKRIRKFVEQVVEKLGYVNSRIDIKPAPLATEGHLSHLFAVRVNATDKENLKLFAKVSDMGPEARAKSGTFGNIYEMECKFYSVIAEKFERIYNKHGIPKEQRLALPKCYGQIETEFEEIILLENLAEKGFTCLSQKEVLTWKYAASSAVQMAKLHAVSAALMNENADFVNNIMTPLEYDIFCEDNLKQFLPQLKRVIASLDYTYKERFENWFFTEMEVMFKKFKKDKMLLIQGDSRQTNFMHREKDGNTETVMLDLQFLRRSNPVVDLMYFMFLSSDQEFRENNYEKFFDFYYSQLSLELQRLGIDIEKYYPRKQFDQHIKDYLLYGVFLGMWILPMCLSEEHNPNAGEGIDILSVKPHGAVIDRINGIASDLALWGVI